MTSRIYEQRDAAFAKVAAYVVLKDGERVALVQFKHGQSVTAYVHWIGVEMTKGRANGGGYDRSSAAVRDAVAKRVKASLAGLGEFEHLQDPVGFAAFAAASLEGDKGAGWERCLRDAGFTVLQAV